MNENGRSDNGFHPPPHERTLTEGLLHYYAIVVRYRWFILSITILAAAGAVGFAVASLRLPPEESPMPNRYRAEAVLLMGEDPAQESVNAVLESLGMPAQGAGTAAASGRLALQVLEGRAFIDRIIERNRMIAYYGMEEASRSKQRSMARSNASFRFNPATGILTISYEDINPVFARTVVDSMVDELSSWFRERGGVTRGATLESLNTTIEEVEGKLAGLQREIRDFQQRYGVLDVEELAATQSAMLLSLETELVQIERGIRTVTERTRIENDPELLRLRAERSTVLDLIARIEAGHSGGSRIMPARAALPDLAMQLSRLQADLAIQQRIRTSLQEQYEIARLSAEYRGAFTVLEEAEVPDEKIGPARSELVLIVTLAAFAASVGFSLFINWIRGIRNNPELSRIVAREPARSTPNRVMEYIEK